MASIRRCAVLTVDNLAENTSIIHYIISRRTLSTLIIPPALNTIGNIACVPDTIPSTLLKIIAIIAEKTIILRITVFTILNITDQTITNITIVENISNFTLCTNVIIIAT